MCALSSSLVRAMSGIVSILLFLLCTSAHASANVAQSVASLRCLRSRARSSDKLLDQSHDESSCHECRRRGHKNAQLGARARFGCARFGEGAAAYPSSFQPEMSPSIAPMPQRVLPPHRGSAAPRVSIVGKKVRPVARSISSRGTTKL